MPAFRQRSLIFGNNLDPTDSDHDPESIEFEHLSAMHYKTRNNEPDEHGITQDTATSHDRRSPGSGVGTNEKGKSWKNGTHRTDSSSSLTVAVFYIQLAPSLQFATTWFLPHRLPRPASGSEVNL